MQEFARFRAKHGPLDEQSAEATASILHVDMDAFFVSVELLDRPELRGKPVVVGGRPDQRGVVSAASYEARKYGIHSAMPLRTAGRLCPHAIFLDGHHENMGNGVTASQPSLLNSLRSSKWFRSMRLISISRAPSDCMDIRSQQPTGCFERSHRRRRFLAPAALPQRAWLPKSLPTKPSRAASSGCLQAANSDSWRRCQCEQFPASAKSTERALRALGIETVEQIAAMPQEKLEGIFGQWGTALYRKSRGGDSYEFVIDAEPKSISHNHTFGEDTDDSNALSSMLSHLSQKACKRLREAGLAARTLTLTIRYAGFETHTRSKTLSEPTRLDSDIFAVFQELFRVHRNVRRKVRLLGVSLSGLMHGGEQLDLLDAERRAKLEKLTSATDRLRDRFGFGKVQFGGSLRRDETGHDSDDS